MNWLNRIYNLELNFKTFFVELTEELRPVWREIVCRVKIIETSYAKFQIYCYYSSTG